MRYAVFVILMAAALLSPAASRATPGGAAPRHAQDISAEPGVYLSAYRTASAPPPALAEFTHFVLSQLPGQADDDFRPDAEGNIALAGRLYTAGGVVFKFEAAKLWRGPRGFDRLSFKTEKVGGVHYTFEGRYLEDSEEERGQFITLRGTLTCHADGGQSAGVELSLYQWVEC